MPHDVVLSYRREDLERCTTVFDLIARIGYVPYRDVDDLAPGEDWSPQFEEAIEQAEPEPYLVVLCTKEAVEDPKRVVAEIALAKRLKRTIIPIEFDAGATKFLMGNAGFDSPGRIQYLDALHFKGASASDVRLEDALRRALTRRARRWLGDQRTRIGLWANRLAPKVSFWEATWREYFPQLGPGQFSGAIALTARGGSGKTSLIAHRVRQMLDDLDLYPVLVNETALRSEDELPRGLGARSAADFSHQVEALALKPPGVHRGWKPMRVIFVVDGLDQMILPGDAQQTQLVTGLNRLVNAAPVLIGCRKEVWDAWYANRVSAREVPVRELDETLVRGLLRGHTALDPERFNPLMQVPFFLDITLERSRTWQTPPDDETAFLQRIWSDGKAGGSSGRRALPEDTGRGWILEHLARCQLDQLAYEVPLADLCILPDFQEDYRIGLEELKASRMLVEVPARIPGAGPTIRLRHDLLDNYSMMLVLFKAPDKTQACLELCSRCGKDCGWSLLATVVQAAHDLKYEDLKKALFIEFLFLLDHKKFGAESMTRAWAVTHVLRTCFQPMFRLILEALAGDPVDSLDKDNPSHHQSRPSTLGPPSRLTQEAASTLASTFMELPSGRADDAATVVPVLARGLEMWELKGRFLDALGKYPTSAALDAIVTCARRQLQLRKDLKSLGYVAQSLRHFPQPESRALLHELTQDASLGTKIRRLAAEGLNHLHPGLVGVPPRDEAEIIEGLKPFEKDGKQYTDWHEVQDYAQHLRARLFKGDQFGPLVLEALINALRHDQTYVRRAVAMALACFDDPTARDAVLNELLEADVAAEVRVACLAALKEQLERVAGPHARQAFRFLLLRAARAARHAGAGVTEQGLIELSLRKGHGAHEDMLLTPAALEVLSPRRDPWTVATSMADDQPHPGVLRELQALQTEDVGEERESKYRIANLKATEGVLSLSLAPSSWRLGKSFHNALRDQPTRFLSDGGRWLVPIPLEDAQLPGLAVVHVLVLTSDGQVLLAQRARTLGYAPLHWSVSFEEQVTEADLREPNRVFHIAAQRGLFEEFGILADLSRVHLLSALLEMENLNLAAVMLIDAVETAETIHATWAGDPRPSHFWEAEAVDGMTANVDTLDELAGGAEFPRGPLHPTSRLRAAMLARWLRTRSAE